MEGDLGEPLPTPDTNSTPCWWANLSKSKSAEGSGCQRIALVHDFGGNGGLVSDDAIEEVVRVVTIDVSHVGGDTSAHPIKEAGDAIGVERFIPERIREIRAAAGAGVPREPSHRLPHHRRRHLPPEVFGSMDSGWATITPAPLSEGAKARNRFTSMRSRFAADAATEANSQAHGAMRSMIDYRL